MKIRPIIVGLFGVLLLLGGLQVWYNKFHLSSGSDKRIQDELSFTGTNDMGTEDGNDTIPGSSTVLPLDLLSGDLQQDASVRQKQFAQKEGTEDLYQKYLLAVYLHEKYDDTKALSLAISYATKLGRFDEAYDLIELLPDAGMMHDAVDAAVLMKLLFNSSSTLDFGRLKQLKELINTLLEQKKISTTDHDFYFLLITLIKGDMANTKYYLEQLRGTIYDDRYTQLHQLELVRDSYDNAPEYYVWGLWSMYLYQQGWWGPSLHIAQEVRQQDPNYLLADQLIAYNSIALQQWTGAVYALQHLQQIDPTYQDIYQFFQGIAHYYAEEYQVSIALMHNISTESAYYHDAARYMYLAYVAVGDWIHAGESASAIVTKTDLVISDVYTLFDTFFFGSGQLGQVSPLYAQNSAVIEQALQTCEQQFTTQAYVCLYGKAGRFLAHAEYEKALQALKRVVQRYPRYSLYKTMGDISLYLKKEDEATKRYEQAFLLQDAGSETGALQGMPSMDFGAKNSVR